jgi:membrane peptidoglycan carboxypeptidase
MPLTLGGDAFPPTPYFLHDPQQRVPHEQSVTMTWEPWQGGTTNDFVDAWFVGFTPSLVAGLWVGFDTPRTIVKNGFAGQLAVPMWASFMKIATKNLPSEWLNPPRDLVAVEVCRLSGALPGEGCRHAASISATGAVIFKSMVYTEYFVRGTDRRKRQGPTVRSSPPASLRRDADLLPPSQEGATVCWCCPGSAMRRS